MKEHYRRLGIGQRDIVALGPPMGNNIKPMNPSIALTRGVSNTAFSISLYAHGPLPLTRLTVLGQVTDLYPTADTGMSDPYIPFASGPNRVTDACKRWELSGGVTESQLEAFAEAIQPSGKQALACTSAAIGAGIGKYSRYSSLDGFGCAGDFAYAFVVVPVPTPAGAVEGTDLLRLTNTGWVHVDRTAPCEDGSVPTAIFQPACETN